MKIIFFGSDDFAATHLDILLTTHHHVVACVTQPDRVSGRGLKQIISPIKQCAQDHHIPCLQPDSFKDSSILTQLKDYEADLFVVVSYGRLLPQALLDIPKIFCVNVHGSLLPHYRGAAPINWAIINGDASTGISVQKMVLTLDAGDIIAQESLPISPAATASTLRLLMAEKGARLLIQTIDHIAKGEHQLSVQDENKMTYAPKLNKEMANINWHEPAMLIERKIRALTPWPGSQTMLGGKMIKIHEAKVVSQQAKLATIVSISPEGIVVACAQDSLLIISLQPVSGKIMPAYHFAQGTKLRIGDLLV